MLVAGPVGGSGAGRRALLADTLPSLAHDVRGCQPGLLCTGLGGTHTAQAPRRDGHGGAVHDIAAGDRLDPVIGCRADQTARDEPRCLTDEPAEHHTTSIKITKRRNPRVRRRPQPTAAIRSSVRGLHGMTGTG